MCLLQAAIQLRLTEWQYRYAKLIEKTLQFTTAQVDAEKLRGKVGYLMSLIENDCLGARQKFDEALLFHSEIGKQQMVVDHDEIGFLCRASRLDHMTLLVQRASIAETVVGRRGDERPDGRVLLDFGQLGTIAADSSMTPFPNLIQVVGKSV